jgi:hypothetical protein
MLDAHPVILVHPRQFLRFGVSPLDQLRVMLRRLDASLGFLLKSVQDVNRLASGVLKCVDGVLSTGDNSVHEIPQIGNVLTSIANPFKLTF